MPMVLQVTPPMVICVPSVSVPLPPVNGIIHTFVPSMWISPPFEALIVRLPQVVLVVPDRP